MGYVIRYGKRDPREIGGMMGKLSWSGSFALMMVILAVLVRLMLPQSATILRNLLIPGMPDSAAASFSEMIESVRNGTGLTDAVEVFCQEVLMDAGT